MGYDVVVEDVPGLIRRIGDYVVEGSNNAAIILGTDRAANGPASIDDGYGSDPSSGTGAGSIHIVVGRGWQPASPGSPGPGTLNSGSNPNCDPDFVNDLAYIYTTMKSDIDTALGLSAESATNSTPGIILKSDVLRQVFRQNFKLAIDGEKNYVYVDKDALTANINGVIFKIDGTNNKVTTTVGNAVVTIDGNANTATVAAGTINLGAANATHPIILGDTFMTYFNSQFIQAGYMTHVHPTAVGPSGPPVAPPPTMPQSTLSTISSCSS